MPLNSALMPIVPPASQALPGYDLVLSEAMRQNLAVAMSLREAAWRLCEAGVRTFKPALSEAEVQAEVRAQFRRATG